MSDTGDGLLPRARPSPHSHNPLVRYFRVLGPGLVTGASDDDPSGITTYSVAGASLGYGMLWTAVATLPLMAAVQLICARIGLVTGQGLAAVLRRHYPRPLLYAACLLLLVANVFNISADLGGMAEAAEMLSGVSALVWVPVFGVSIVLVVVYASYVAFCAGAEVAHRHPASPISWPRCWRARTGAPPWRPRSFRASASTRSRSPPWWRSSAPPSRRISLAGLAGGGGGEGARPARASQRRGATPHELADAALDVNTGMFFPTSSCIFIILATAATLHRAGHREIESARQAARRCRPLAGDAAYLLYALGLIGTGLLAILVLAGSASFAVAELCSAGARDSRSSPGARGASTIVIAGSILGGMILTLVEHNPVRVPSSRPWSTGSSRRRCSSW